MDWFGFACLLSVTRLSVLKTIGGQYSRCPIDVRRAILADHPAAITSRRAHFLILFSPGEWPYSQVTQRRTEREADHLFGWQGGSLCPHSCQRVMLYTKGIACHEGKNKACRQLKRSVDARKAYK